MTLLSVAEAARLVGRDPSRLLQLIREGRLPAEKIGSYYAVRERDVLRVFAKMPKAGRPSRR